MTRTSPKRGKEHIKETSLKLSQNLSEHILHTQAREIQCLKCLGKGHLAYQCSNERSMILRNKDNNSIQEKETNESEEKVKIENQEKVLMDQSEVWEKSVPVHTVIQKEEKIENKIENILLSEQPSNLHSRKGTLVEICELPPQEKKFLKEFDDIFPKENTIELPSIRGIKHQIDLVLGASLLIKSDQVL